ncbi:type II toxin-antitoxin system RelB/DinJ family antitoxin [Desulfovibrio sp. JC010]|uniref:type II toxin-antitoxin system RelB/DinJ family antitoxin n=1 Tax=Desulfovibrio sp. JC010 TaxID=2593641 RepID=UPI0013D38289|nr:type II toxin-antitoxin system RelB/DinJ family antitoxin [Desulfovibrio sp. JC010]NDV25135.1 type II toxin-antitoxin system RelB/DinJ family antitoxin [Desulfovibrio sp. JC010]
MPPKSSMLHVRVDPAVKAEAAEALSGVGLSLSDAVRILLTRIAREGGLPAGLTCTEKEHDRWFKAKVHAALKDERPTSEHNQVMDEAEELLSLLSKDK